MPEGKEELCTNRKGPAGELGSGAVDTLAPEEEEEEGDDDVKSAAEEPAVEAGSMGSEEDSTRPFRRFGFGGGGGDCGEP
jgi:hypothetical protein